MLALRQEQDEYACQHLTVAIWRNVTTGSLTRNGGVVSSASFDGKIVTGSGEMKGMAMVWDEVTYPDGTTALLSVVPAVPSALAGKGEAQGVCKLTMMWWIMCDLSRLCLLLDYAGAPVFRKI